ncbi:hypothetical protein EMIT0347P_20044 [Pseudomonas sp. IT-347P]
MFYIFYINLISFLMSSGYLASQTR